MDKKNEIDETQDTQETSLENEETKVLDVVEEVEEENSEKESPKYAVIDLSEDASSQEANENNNEAITKDEPADSQEVAEEVAEVETELDKTRKTTVKVIITMTVLLVVAIVAIVVMAIAIVNQPKTTTVADTNTSATTTQQEQKAVEYDGGDHNHAWESNMVTVEAPKLTKTVEHPAEYEVQEVKHTICNVCNEIIDNRTAQHAQETGHSGYTTNVPIKEEVLVKDAWTETVTVQEYQSKTIQSGEKCRVCGLVKDEKTHEELMKELGFKEKVDE